MNSRVSDWIVVITAITFQFLLELTLGRSLVAPAILVPVLVYLSISRGDFWAVEGAFWGGFMLDLLLHQKPGISSLAIILGISFSRWLLSVTTGAVRMTFVANALIASLAADLLFILLSASPAGSGFGVRTLLLIPRTILPLMLYLTIPLLFSGRSSGNIKQLS